MARSDSDHTDTGRRSFERDLAAWAEERRSALGEPPTAEQLIELRDGKLSDEDAERLHDRLAVDPEWADVYLDLQRGAELPRRSGGLAAEAEPDDDVDRAWQSLVARLEAEHPAATEAEPAEKRAGRLRRRSLTPFVGLAAALVLALGLGWLLGRDTDPVPTGDYYEVIVTGEVFRDPRLSLPRSTSGLAFHIDLTGLSGRLKAELRDASGTVIQQEEHQVGEGDWIVRVPRSSLRSGRTYVLIVRSAEASAEDPPIMSPRYTPVLEE